MTTSTVSQTLQSQYNESKGMSPGESNHQEVLSLIQNLKTRWFFFEKEGRTSKQLNHLNRAYNALRSKLPEQFDPLTEWKLAYENANRQFEHEIAYIEPNTAMPQYRHVTTHRKVRVPHHKLSIAPPPIGPLHPDTTIATQFIQEWQSVTRREEVKPTSFRKGYVQPEMAPDNDLMADFMAEEKPYNGSDFDENRDLDDILGSQRWKTIDTEYLADYMKYLRDLALEGIMDSEVNADLAALREYAWLATLNLPLVEWKKYQPWKIDPAHMWHMEKYILEEVELSDTFLKDLAIMLSAADYDGFKIEKFDEVTRKLRRNEKYAKTLRTRLKDFARAQHFSSEILEDPDELYLLKDPREVALEDHTPQSITPDLSLQLRHQGWTYNRKATVGVGTSDPIQMLFHMSTEVFYSFLRRRTHKFPRVEIHKLMNPTAYKVVDGKRVVASHHNIDNYVRALAMCRWHDEAHGTSYFEAAKKVFLDTLNFAPQVIELATIACQASPGTVDEFNVNLFWKEDKFLKKHRYGYHHSKAQA